MTGAVNWEEVINIALLALLVVVTIGIIRVRDLFAVVMLAGIFSLIMAAAFTILDAVDVAFTEAAVGAGIATILSLGTLALIDNRREKVPKRFQVTPLLVSAVTCVALLWATGELPEVGAADNPTQTHVAPHYLNESPNEIDVPNVVTAVLASYRGFDTLGEVAVIFTAGVGVMYLLSAMPVIGGRRRSRRRRTEDGS
jgi:multicomponent Na+:H+ antiporter subunit B